MASDRTDAMVSTEETAIELFLNKNADLLFHYLMLLQAKGFKLKDIVDVLKVREKKQFLLTQIYKY